MKNVAKIIVCTLCMVFAIFSCAKNESIHVDSSVTLDKLTASGKIGDTIKTRVNFTNNSIAKLVITKSIDGITNTDYKTEITVNGTSSGYDFSQMILSGDENGSLVYTFSGYDAGGKLIDASDLVVSVSLSGYPLLTKYDWKLTAETVDGTNTVNDKLWDNVYRLNPDYSWQYDWGASGPVNLEELNQYCSWKIIGSESKVDSLSFIKFGFLSTTPVYDTWKVAKLEGEDLWLSTTMDLSWLGLSAETPIVQRYVAIPKTADFTPYRGQNAADYNWAPCNPGTYKETTMP